MKDRILFPTYTLVDYDPNWRVSKECLEAIRKLQNSYLEEFNRKWQSCLNALCDPETLDRLKRIEIAYQLANWDGFRL